jgi:hypothetical protein
MFTRKAAAEAEAGYQQLESEYQQEQREEHQHHTPARKKQAGTANSGAPGSTAPSGAPAAPGTGCSAGSKLSACRKAAAQAAQDVSQAVGEALAALLGPALNSIASCVTHPTVPGCLAAAGNVILIGAGFADAGASEESGGIAEDAAAACGGESFTASTKVLLASGAAIPISQLKAGDKVLATNTKTGKTQAETVAAVLVHHDTNLYDLTVKTAHGVAVIDTTTTHLFWDHYLHHWVTANKLSKGEHLKTADGTLAVADGGTTPKDHDGWMWDLTVPGNNDHDFYIIASSTAVLVHNQDECGISNANQGQASVEQTVTDLEAAGGRILGREISLRAADWRARADLYAELPSGQRAFIEVKTGPGADLSPNQEAVYAETRSSGAVPYGANAAKAEGLTPGVPTGSTPVWVVHQPWPLTLEP